MRHRLPSGNCSCLTGLMTVGTVRNGHVGADLNGAAVGCASKHRWCPLLLTSLSLSLTWPVRPALSGEYLLDRVGLKLVSQPSCRASTPAHLPGQEYHAAAIESFCFRAGGVAGVRAP